MSNLHQPHLQYYCDPQAKTCGTVNKYGEPYNAIVYQDPVECMQNCPVTNACRSWLQGASANFQCNSDQQCQDTFAQQTSCDTSPDVVTKCLNGQCAYAAKQ